MSDILQAAIFENLALVFCNQEDSRDSQKLRHCASPESSLQWDFKRLSKSSTVGGLVLPTSPTSTNRQAHHLGDISSLRARSFG
jgi:hypothetical protein